MPTAEQLARSRDLKTQLNELARESDQEIIFKETSPPKQRVRVYSRTDGEPLDIPIDLATRALDKRLPDGGFMFTTRASEAPEYRRGGTKCFLHEESTDRQSGALDEVGLAGIVCNAASLANQYSKRIHAIHRHRQQWEAYQEHLNNERERVREERQQAQIDATLALARQAAPKKKEAPDAVAE